MNDTGGGDGRERGDTHTERGPGPSKTVPWYRIPLYPVQLYMYGTPYDMRSHQFLPRSRSRSLSLSVYV